MKKIYLLLTPLFLLSFLFQPDIVRAQDPGSKTIVFVTDDDEDDEQINWLKSLGFNVQEYGHISLSTAPAADIDMLNAADLVIIGRSPSTTALAEADADREAWNNLTVPLISNNQWAVRNNRLNWFDQVAEPAHYNTEGEIVRAVVQESDDEVFSNVEIGEDNMIPWLVTPSNLLLAKPETVSNGTILATSAPGDAGNAEGGAVLMVRFEAGTEFYAGAGDAPEGPRTYFGFGNDNVGYSHFFPLTSQGRKVYLNEINRILGTNVVLAELKHSYTFEDGTATDVVGGADGTPTGGSFSDGAFISDGEGGIITLPAGDIAINTYPAITLEAFVSTSGANAGNNTMLAYFGDSPEGLGANGYFIQPTRTNGQSRTAISTGNTTQPWTTETGVSADGVDATGFHHMVSILTNDSISWFIDGEHVGTAYLADDAFGNSIEKLSNNFAWLARGGYQNDPVWLGAIHEFNIYSGVLAPATIEARAEEFLTAVAPTLSALTVTMGEEEFDLAPAFLPEVTDYVVKVPRGTTSVTIAATPITEEFTVEGAGELQLVEGSATATIVVTNSSGESATYSLLVEELSNDATLSDIEVTVGEETYTLTPEFDPSVNAYEVEVPKGTTSVSVTATPTHAGAAVAGAGSKDIVAGMANFKIEVTAEDEETENAYDVKVMVEGIASDATLSELSFPQGTMTPEFDPEITEYNVVITENIDKTVNFILEPSVEDAILESEHAQENFVDLSEEGTATAVITIKSMDGTATKTYTVNIVKQAPTAVGKDVAELVKVYPTVSDGAFTVQFAGSPGKVTIYDLSGKVIVQQTAATSQIQVNVPQAGMFIFHIQTKEVSKKVKVFRVN